MRAYLCEKFLPFKIYPDTLVIPFDVFLYSLSYLIVHPNEDILFLAWFPTQVNCLVFILLG